MLAQYFPVKPLAILVLLASSRVSLRHRVVSIVAEPSILPLRSPSPHRPCDGRRRLIYEPSFTAKTHTPHPRRRMQAQPAPLVNEFRAGVTACLRSWSALKHAVESGWGGVDSVRKADDLRQVIIDQIEKGQLTDPIDLEDNLAIFMEEEFSLQLEDGSERQVADCIWMMFQQCRRGDATLVHQVIRGAEEAAEIAQKVPSQYQANENDDDDEDMEDASDDQPPQLCVVSILHSQPDYATQSLFGKPKKVSTVSDHSVRQLGEQAASKPTVETDDDGFAPVTKGRRKVQ